MGSVEGAPASLLVVLLLLLLLLLPRLLRLDSSTNKVPDGSVPPCFHQCGKTAYKRCVPQTSTNTTAATTPRQNAGTNRKEEPREEEVRAADMGPSSPSPPPVLLLPPASGVMVVEGVGMLRPHHPYMCHC